MFWIYGKSEERLTKRTYVSEVEGNKMEMEG